MEMTSIKEETESTSVKLGSQPSSLSRSSSSSSPATSDKANSGSVKVPAIRRFARTSSLASNLATQTKLKALSASIVQASAHDSISVESIRLNLKRFLQSSYFGEFLENFIILLSVVSCIEYIMETYNPAPFYIVMEMVLSGFFCLDWLLNLFLADFIMSYLTSFYSLIDLLSVFPIWIIFLVFDNRPPPDINDIDSFSAGILYLLYALGTLRILRSLRVQKVFANTKDPVDRYLYGMITSLVTIVLYFSAVMQFVEETSQPLPFHDWTYFIWITITTVGYGDISPISTIGKMSIIFMIAFAVVLIPLMTNELSDVMKLQSVYARASYVPRSRLSKHIVVCGDLSSISLSQFFDELFHEDHDTKALAVVILLPQPPTKEILLMLRDPILSLSVQFLEGSVLNEEDLARAKVESCCAVFLMCNKFTRNADEEDAKNILQSLSIKRYVSKFEEIKDKKMYCIQLIKPDNLRHLPNRDSNDIHDICVCQNELKMGAIAKSILYPGANTMIMNLLKSFSDSEIEESSKEELPWLREYKQGCAWEIYNTKLATIFVGAKFSSVAQALYDSLGIVLFALEVSTRATEYHLGFSKILLNPGNYIIPDEKDFDITGFVIAPDQNAANISFLDEQEMNTEGASSNIFNNIFNETLSGLRKSSNILRRASNIQGDVEGGTHIRSTLGEHNLGKPAQSGKKNWDILKRKSLLERKISSHSEREIHQDLEEKHLQEQYYVREAPYPSQSEVEIQTNVLDELPFINHHIIIMGKGLSNLVDLIRPLRSKSVGKLVFVIILYPSTIPTDIWLKINAFESIYIVRGSLLEENNLKRAGIFRASQVLLLSDGLSAEDDDVITESLFADADAIFVYKSIVKLNRNANILVEIIREDSIFYLTDKQEHSSDHRFSSEFAGGHLYMSSLLDSIVCQAYFNPQIVRVVNKLISGPDDLVRNELTGQAQDEAVDHSKEVLDTLNKGKNTPKTYDRNKRTAIRLIKESCLYQIEIPAKLHGKTYKELFQHFTSIGVVPIGLFRGVIPEGITGYMGNTQPYVFTNPPPNVQLFSQDRVFVLSQKIHQMFQKFDVKDWVLELQKNNFGGYKKLMKGSNEDGSPDTPGGVALGSGVGDASPKRGVEASMKGVEETVKRQMSSLTQDLNSKLLDMNKKVEHLTGVIEKQSRLLSQSLTESQTQAQLQVQTQPSPSPSPSEKKMYSSMNDSISAIRDAGGSYTDSGHTGLGSGSPNGITSPAAYRVKESYSSPDLSFISLEGPTIQSTKDFSLDHVNGMYSPSSPPKGLSSSGSASSSSSRGSPSISSGAKSRSTSFGGGGRQFPGVRRTSKILPESGLDLEDVGVDGSIISTGSVRFKTASEEHGLGSGFDLVDDVSAPTSRKPRSRSGEGWQNAIPGPKLDAVFDREYILADSPAKKREGQRENPPKSLFDREDEAELKQGSSLEEMSFISLTIDSKISNKDRDSVQANKDKDRTLMAQRKQ